LDQVVVLFMGADPEPNDQVVGSSRESTVRWPDPHGPDVIDQGLELQGRVKRIALPKPVLFPGTSLNLLR
jgi:hypothetical protein